MKIFKKWLWPALIVLFLVFAFSRLDARSVWDSLLQVPVWTIFLLVGLQIVSQLLVNFQWFQIAKRFGSGISFGKMLNVNCRGNVVDAVTPGVKIGGEVARAVHIKKITNGSGADAAAVVAVQKMFSVSALFLSVLLTAGYLVDHLPVFVFILPFGLGLVVFIGCIFVKPDRINAFLHKKAPSGRIWVNKFRTFLITVTEHLGTLSKPTLLLLFALSFLIWLLYPVKLFILAMPLAPDVGFLFVGAIAFASYIVAMLPVFPGGLGGFEGTMTGLFVAVGLVIGDAVVITVLFRFLTFWLVLLLSLAYIGFVKFLLRVRSRKRV